MKPARERREDYHDWLFDDGLNPVNRVCSWVGLALVAGLVTMLVILEMKR